MTKAAELTGQKFGRLFVVSGAGSKGGKSQWYCECECGGNTTTTTSHLKSGHTNSCGCFRKEQALAQVTTHGMSTTPEYRHYADMIARCTCPTNTSYEYYGAKGIGVNPVFVENFLVWYKEMGPKPEGKWTVGRKDNTIGYEPGNIRWETMAQQARNHAKQSNNTSGITGVEVYDSPLGHKVYKARWVDLDGTRRTKLFNESKFGDKAKEMAIELRNTMIAKLNMEGADYAQTHGADKTR